MVLFNTFTNTLFTVKKIRYLSRLVDRITQQ